MNLSTPVFRRCEIVLHSDKTYDNPFLDVNIDAVFTDEAGTRITLPGFWNGENEWKVRFISQKPGKWHYTVTCTDKDNASLTDSGTITVTAAEPRNDLEKHGYIVIPEGKRYYTYGDGTPFFWLGDTHWQGPDFERLHECNYPGCTCGSQFKHVVDDRLKKRFTIFQTYLNAGDPANKWWTEKYTRINPQSFNEILDVMVEYLAEKGFTTAMGFGLHTGTPVAMRSDPAPLLAIARYCVARYACYPLVWITAQEITDVRYQSYEIWKQVGALVGELDGFHRPNGAHMYPYNADHEVTTDLDQQPWHQQWILQAGHGGILKLKSRRFYQGYYENKKVKPFIEGECHYEDIYCAGFCGCDASRIGAWQAMQSGAAGFTYGVTGVWAPQWNTTDDRRWLSYSPEPWYIGMDKPGSTEMTYLRRFYEYVGWTDLEPSYDYTFGSFEMRRFVSIAHKGQDIIIYHFFNVADEKSGGSLRGLKPNVKYQARWYDPIHGGFIDLPDVITEDGTCAIPSAPAARDWVLLLNCVEMGDYPRLAYPGMSRPIPVSDAKPGEEWKIVHIRTSSEDPEHPAQNLIDGNDDTFWQGLAAKTSQTIIADLGEDKKLGYLFMATPMPTSRLMYFRVYGSHDGQAWDLLAERADDALVALGGQYPTYFEPISGSYRYVKFFLRSTELDNRLPLSKFALYAPQE